ncbi:MULTISPECIES: hypothetical protein [unclassified Burkholderia]|nr:MULTISPECIES: hypothetical protein [unclassified Burkholderia]
MSRHPALELKPLVVAQVDDQGAIDMIRFFRFPKLIFDVMH